MKSDNRKNHLNEYNYFKKNLIKLNRLKNYCLLESRLQKEIDQGLFNNVYILNKNLPQGTNSSINETKTKFQNKENKIMETEGLKSTIKFPIVNQNKVSSKNLLENSENSTFQETNNQEMVDKGNSVYFTMKSEKSEKTNNNSPKKYNFKNIFNLYTNSNPGYTLNSNYNSNTTNTFLTNSKFFNQDFSNRKEKISINIMKENKNDNKNIESKISENQKNTVESKIIIDRTNGEYFSPKYSRQYFKISSFENKFNNELARISRRYGKFDTRIKFQDNLLEKNIDKIPDFDYYKSLKILNNKGNYKFKLLPITEIKKNGYNYLGNKFFNNLKHEDPQYFDINQHWEYYINHEKNRQTQEEIKFNELNFDFSKDYKNLEEEDKNFNDYYQPKIMNSPKNLKFTNKILSNNKNLILNNNPIYDLDYNLIKK